jgi:hypothetical protein
MLLKLLLLLSFVENVHMQYRINTEYLSTYGTYLLVAVYYLPEYLPLLVVYLQYFAAAGTESISSLLLFLLCFQPSVTVATLWYSHLDFFVSIYLPTFLLL